MNQWERERLFIEIFHSNRARILRLCYGYLGSGQEVEDLFQEIMANVWTSLPGFRNEASASTWLYRIAVNTALLYRRKWKRREAPFDPSADFADPRGHSDERIFGLRRAVAALPEQDRLIVAMLLDGLSYKEIAAVTGITVNYAGVKIARIKQALEKLMTEPANAIV